MAANLARSFGAFVGASLFLHIMLCILTPGSIATFSDGLTYWASVFVPSFGLGLPLIIFGGLVEPNVVAHESIA